jgi:hypothetical protein
LASRARPCAARTRLFGFIATPNGALRAPPSPPIAASYSTPKNIYNLLNLGRPRQGLFSFHWTPEAMKYDVLCPLPAHRSFADPSGNIFGVKLCTDATIRHNFVVFSFSIVFGSFLFVILFFFFSPFQFLLILLFLSFSSNPTLLILLYLSFSTYLFLFFLFPPLPSQLR